MDLGTGGAGYHILTGGGLDPQERAQEVGGVLELQEHPPECGWSLALLG